MSRVQIVKIDKWYGGISDDVREQSGNQFAHSEHFDITTNPTRLTPYRSMESDDTISGTSSTMPTFVIQNFLYANDKLYAYGKVSGTLDAPRLIEKTAGNFPSGSWALSATATATSGLRAPNTFIHYKNYIYGFKGGNTVWRYGDITATKSLDNAWKTIGTTYTTTAQGIVGKDDNLYIFYDNVVVKIDAAGNLTDARLTLPSDLIITGAAWWGNQLAIACKPKQSIGLSSKVFLWDYVSDDVSDVIDWGQGDLLVIANLEGNLVGISRKAATSAVINSRTFVKSWAGGSVNIIKELPYGGLIQRRSVVNNKLYFSISDDTTLGLWIVGRKSGDYPMAITCDRLFNNNTAVSSVKTFIVLDDYVFASIGTTASIMRTDDQATYNCTSTVITDKLNFGSLHKRKSLEALSLAFPALPSGGAVTLSYRVDQNTSWKTIFSESTANSIYHESVNEEPTQVNFDDFNEIQFRVQSRGGAEVEELKLKVREHDSQIDNNEPEQ